MRLDIRKPHQKQACRAATITFNGVRQTECVVADEEKGYIEVQTGTRMVGMAEKPVLRRTYGKVIITIPVAPAPRSFTIGTVTHTIPPPDARIIRG